jgi:threonine aldolase
MVAVRTCNVRRNRATNKYLGCATLNFMSDGRAYAHAQVLQRLSEYRPTFADVFEDDPLTAELQRRVSHIFEAAADVFVVATGTASNGLGLAALCQPFGAILCHWDAHIQTDECGGPIWFTGGATLCSLEGENGKIKLAALRATLENTRFGVAHRVQPQVLSLTQATEAGTLYGVDELAELTAVSKHYGLRVHMDGARFANAVAALGCTPAELSWKAGVDILSLGATKNGAIAAEAVIVFDRELSRRLRYVQKRSGHFIAKSSLVSAQLDAYLSDDLWLRNASHANAQAKNLCAALGGFAGVSLVNPVEANQVFVTMPQRLVDYLRGAGVRFDVDWRTYPLRHHRFSASFATRSEEIDALSDLHGGWREMAARQQRAE